MRLYRDGRQISNRHKRCIRDSTPGSLLGGIVRLSLSKWAVSMIQWSPPKFDLLSSIPIQLSFIAFTTLYAVVNVGLPTTLSTSFILMGKAVMYCSTVFVVIS
jgi:hypothetical protein